MKGDGRGLDKAGLPTAVALFAWGLPLWTFIEIATSAARAAISSPSPANRRASAAVKPDDHV